MINVSQNEVKKEKLEWLVQLKKVIFLQFVILDKDSYYNNDIMPNLEEF